MKKHYCERDLLEMDRAGNHYGNHVMALTAEQLHSKSDIAAELGWRDMQIAELKAQRDALQEKFDFKQNLTKQVVELQKQRDALAAENTALRSGATYFACGSEYGFDLFKDKQSAIDTCVEEIELHREGYLDGDGWGDEVRKTAWGIVVQSAQGRDAQGRHTSDSQHTYQTCNYRLEDEVQTPVTDAYLNSVRAEALPAEVAEIIDSGDLESILFASDAPFSEQFRMALYKFRQLRAGEPS
ncbi:hypothetical protein [Pantoea vagans]|uniref:hypothetical protein n=1 Tax=Pantoea vagans TaxID=470934 RepID=UPI00076B7B4D|nr:hypothetical protein [Pantoea vagans]AMG57714.1 hypothetical protein AL522_08740 [Pantoea vagans]